MIRKLVLTFSAMLLSIALNAQTVSVDWQRIGGIRISSNLYDSLNTALKVNCVAGCTGGGGTSSSVTINDPTITTQKLAVDVNGRVGINNFPTTQPVSGTFWQVTQPVSLAVAPTTPVTGTFWQATQPVSIASMPSTPVTGTFWQATQPVSGTFWQPTQPVSIASMPSTPVTGTFWQATQPVSGTFFQATQPVSIASMPSTPVTGTFWQATQPVSGTFFQATQPVSISATVPVKALVDTARTLLVCSAVEVAWVTTEGLYTMTCNKGGTNQTAATTYTVTAAKTLRINSLVVYARNTGTAAIVADQFFVRSGATCTATSPIIAFEAVGTEAAATLLFNDRSTVSYPDGIEIATGQLICVSHISRNTVNGVDTFVLTGFEY